MPFAEEPIPTAEIRQRAYELWDRNHRPEGLEMEFWLVAERELRAERRGRNGSAADDGEGAATPGTNDDQAIAEPLKTI